MSRYTLYAIVPSFLAFLMLGCTQDGGSGGPSGSNTEADAGDDFREYPNADAILWDLSDAGTQDDTAISGEICDNLVDDDGDQAIDCDDEDCTGHTACLTEIELDCDNDLDDDGDLRVDCDDLDCAAATNCQQPVGDEDCDNQVDDDADGLTDCYDGDCALDSACRATTAEDCFNSTDDDGDSLVDCNDPDCERACEEGPQGGDEEMMLLCLIMCMMDPDPMTCLTECMGGGMGMGETDCTNGVDDDQNGTTDCEDMACMMDPACM